MLGGPAWLGLEAKYLPPVREFYVETLDMPVRQSSPAAVHLGAGDGELRIRTPGEVPRGGLHTHFAFSVPAASYDAWYDHLSSDFDLEEVTFGSATSLYLDDPEGNCVELGQDHEVDGDDRRISGIFEVVLEVEQLVRAEHFYRALGFEVVDRGDDRDRIRMQSGDLALELWEPHLGIADARGGVHVDLGLYAERPQAVAGRVTGQALAVTDPGRGRRVKDPDGHWVTLVPPDGE